MRSIATIQQKGGVGKSTLACNLAAFYASQQGMRVWLIDMDPQASAYRWGEVRAKQQPDAPLVRVVMAHAAALERTMREARSDRADVVIIDTPQATSMQDVDPGPMVAAGSHLILMPCKPYFFDANAMLKTVREAKAEGRNAYVVFNDVESGTTGGQDIEAAIAGLVALGDLAPRVCDKPVRHNVEFPHASAKGLGVAETTKPTSHPHKDIKALATWALTQAQPMKRAVKASSPGAEVLALDQSLRAKRKA